MKKEDLKEIWSHLSLDKIILIAIAGMVLLLSDPFFSKKSQDREPTEKQEESQESMERQKNYASQLENSLKEILQNVEGVGKTEVMITLENEGEMILNKDISSEESTGMQGDVRQKKEEKTILSEKGGEEAPYIIKEIKPKVAGVVIICEGADKNDIRKAVTEAASVLFSISYHRIRVLKMEESR